MASFENTVTIRRPVEDVFAFLADFENIPKWNYAIVETSKVSPGMSYLLDPTGGGTMLTNAVDLESSGLMTLVAPLATSRVKNAVAANLDKLRQLLEQRGQGG